MIIGASVENTKSYSLQLGDECVYFGQPCVTLLVSKSRDSFTAIICYFRCLRGTLWISCIPCLKKSCAELFLSEFRQMSTNFDNFWHTDSTKDSFMW